MFNFKKVISDRFFQSKIKPQIAELYKISCIDRVFLCSYWMPINSHHELGVVPETVVYTEHESTKGKPKNKPFFIYTKLEMLGNKSLEHFLMFSDVNKRTLFYIQDVNKNYPEMEMFARTVGFKSWTYRIIYKNNKACYALHCTSENQFDFLKSETENKIYEIANIIEAQINKSK